ncbi:integrase arm-type DNA-binding domain-containing protein [Mesorhizobium sp. M0589]|uniref:tyrosine-type recombinase/integrase n=1 Tax=Mesorhizobium sp. M0589 TaxID=2956965 RepID=UPI00333DA275
MARELNKLTDAKCKALSKPGLHGDGGGLYLNVKTGGAKSWAFIWREGRRRREGGIGVYPAVKLATARRTAAEYREAIAEGRDPIAERKRQKAEPTFGEAVTLFLADNEAAWRNEKHKYQWGQTLGDAYCKHMRPMKVSQITTDDVLKALRPHWNTKSETAKRLMGRIERVLAFAKVKGWRTGDNPAAWRGNLDALLPKRKKLLARGHHAAMAYADVPAFIKLLRGQDAISARALEFVILTATRSGEARNAMWSEFDLDAALWTIPAKRMKAGKEHQVPLSDPALAIVKALHDIGAAEDVDYVFPGYQGKPLSDMAFKQLMKRMKVNNCTTHGFRSSFRDWAGNETETPREVAEHALAHIVGNAVENAYRRSTALDKRRKLMDEWAGHLSTTQDGNVVKFSRKKA